MDWSGLEKKLHEAVLTCFMSTGELSQFLTEPFSMPDADCHTQSCERAVKDTTLVFGFERRDGLIKSKLKSRKLVCIVKLKEALKMMLV